MATDTPIPTRGARRGAAATAGAARPTATVGHPVRTRLLATAASVVGAVLAWAIAVHGLGVDLGFAFGSAAVQTVAVGFVVAGALVAPLAGWGVLALLERRTAHAARTFAVLAAVVLVVSFALPALGATTVASGVTLAVLHVVVAAAVVPAFVASSPRR